MPDSKITALTSIGASTDPANDPLVLVDVSDTSMAASGTTKKVTLNQLLGAGGTATLASATISGDLTVDTSTLKVDSTNDNVIVGATSAIGGGRFSVQADLSAKQAICAKNSTASYSATNNFIRFTNSTDATVGGITHPAVTSLGVWGVSDIQFLLSGVGSTAMTLNSTGNLVLKGGTAGATGVGVTFPATQVASSDANCLDDYEEGTWTIGLTFGGASTGMTTATNIGRYTKIGRQVTVSGNLSLSNKGSSTGIAEIQGLPFTIANANEAYSAANVRFNGVSFADIPISIGAIGSTKILLQEITKAGVVTDITDADFTNTSSCVIGFTYTV